MRKHRASDLLLIDKVRKTPLSLPAMKRMNPKAKFFMYDDLQGLHPEDILETGQAIILLDVKGSNSPVGHWIALIDQGGHIEHFDPYGLDIKQELSLTHAQPYLLQILSGIPYKTNPYQLQHLKEDANTCGRWVTCRLRLKEHTIQEFKKLIQEPHIDADITVSLMTYFLDDEP
jgi:hypothetical protein